MLVYRCLSALAGVQASQTVGATMSYQRRKSLVVPLALAVALSLGDARMAEAQFGRLKDRVKAKVAEKVAEKAGEKMGEKMGQQAADSAAKATAASSATTTSTSSGSIEPTTRKEWANYDFVPGARTIFFTDFSEDQVGNFPKR